MAERKATDFSYLLPGRQAHPAFGLSMDERLLFELMKDFGEPLVTDAEERSEILLPSGHAIEGFEHALRESLGALLGGSAVSDLQTHGAVVGEE
jgi:hypothetical protein